MRRNLYGLKYVCVWCIICAVYLKRCALSLIYYSTAYTLTVIPQHKRAFHSKFNIYFACCELNSTLATAAQRKIVYRIFLLKILLCVHKQDNTLLPRYAKLIILNFKWKLRLKKKGYRGEINVIKMNLIYAHQHCLFLQNRNR